MLKILNPVIKKTIALVIIIFLIVIASILIYYNLSSNVIEVKENEDKNRSRNYIAQSVEECETIQFLCAENYESFYDETGCGCEMISKNGNKDAVDKKTYCPEKQEGEQTGCIALYDPVCGWFKSEIECIRYPCAATYGNGCNACQDENVEYYTKGECQT